MTMGNRFVTSVGMSKFREMFDALPVAVFASDERGKLTYFNEAAIGLCGEIPELGSNQWCASWRLAQAEGAAAGDVQPALEPWKPGDFAGATGRELTGQRPNGTRFWFQLYLTPVRDAAGDPAGALYVLLDITEQRAAQYQTESQFRAVFEANPECVKMVARDGTLLHMNPAGMSMVAALGYGDVIGSSVYELIAKEHRDLYRAFHERICAGEKGFLEFDLAGVHRGRRSMETHSVPLNLADGTTVQLAVTRDITERKKAEQSALLLSAIVDSSDDAIISKDLDGVITSWNKSAERLFGYTAAEAVGQPVAALLIPADRQDEEPNILRRLRRGERVDHFQTVRRRKDGSLLDISLTISPVKDQSGRIIGASKIARDITEMARSHESLRQANLSLARSNSDLEHFAYAASHDLQEPLRMVHAYAELLRRKLDGQLPADGEEYISYIVDGASRMERLLQDVRAYTHASLARDGAAGRVDANLALAEGLAILRPEIEESGAEIHADLLPLVRIHQFQLGQLFQNIVGNAIRYRSSERPRIRIAAVRVGPDWQFSVRDNGIGIDPEYKEQIFGIFKRLHAPSEYPGTGMGLAICQRIVERAGGRIWVESEPGVGSAFFFSLPAD